MRPKLPNASNVRTRRAQAGIFMAELGMALLISGIAAVGVLQGMILANRLKAADTQADSAKTYRTALQNYVTEQFLPLQQGLPVTHLGVTLPAGSGLGQTMQPDIASLIAMHYLPEGFKDDVAMVAGATYRNLIELEPAGCAPGPACSPIGLAYISAPVVHSGTADFDDVVVGEMLSRIGGDIGVSMPGSEAILTAAGSGWTYPNPVPGQPAGVVGMRFGYDTSGLSAFVRMNDTRDPSLRGNFSALGNLNVGGTSALAGALTVNADSTLKGNLVVQDATSNNCVSLDRAGVVTIACAGQLNAKSGIFTDGLGNTTSIDANGITATGRVNAAQGLATASGTVFDSTDPEAITVVAGQQFFRGASGGLTLMTLDNGDVVAGRNVSAQRLALQSTVSPGTACTPTSGAVTGSATEYAATATGGIAVCSGGAWVSLTNRATANSACAPNGTIATDTATGTGLVCKRGYFIPADSIISNYVIGTPFQITGNGFTIAKSSVIACDLQGAGTGIPLVYIIPQNEASQDAAFTRSATDTNPGSNAGSWTFTMQDGGGRPLTSVTAIGVPMCMY